MNTFSQTKPVPPPLKTKPSPLLIVGTIIAILANASLNIFFEMHSSRTAAEIFSFIVGASLVFPLVIVVISTIWKSARNSRTQTWVFFIASIISTLLLLVDFLEAVFKSF
jgi:uncharacterized membrane protein